MSLSTILVHLDADPQCEARLSAAARLAAGHGAYVNGLYVRENRANAALGRTASAAFTEVLRASAGERTAAVEKLFTAVQAREKFAGAWDHAEGDVIETLAARARYADLTVVGHTAPTTFEDVVNAQAPSYLPLHGGGPTLVMPRKSVASDLGRRIVIAWKATAEAMRAVKDAMALLERADAVVALTVHPESGDRSGANLRTFLARHRIKAELQADRGADRDAGPAILAAARAVGADLLVMGAYSRSRWRELVLGGATQHVLENAEIPVLMSR
jgi:nucleotide-binding universal stress UspA family protein